MIELSLSILIAVPLYWLFIIFIKRMKARRISRIRDSLTILNAESIVLKHEQKILKDIWNDYKDD